MAISTLLNRISYAGDGLSVAFAYPYPYFAQEDLKVVLKLSTGVEVAKTLTTHYTVSPTEGTDGAVAASGTVTMITAPAVGETLTLYSDPAASQEIALTENEAIPAPTLNGGYDKLTLMVQRLKDRADRSMRKSEGLAATFDPTLPIDLNTANKALVVNAAGDGWALMADAPTATEIASAAANAASAAASAAAAAASAALAVPMFRDVVFITFADSPFTVTELLHRGKILSCDPTLGNIDIILPQISTLTQLGVAPWVLGIKKTVETNLVSLFRSGTDTIDGSAAVKDLVYNGAATTLIPDTDLVLDRWTSFDSIAHSSLGMTALGDLLTHDGIGTQRIGVGNPTQVLTANPFSGVGVGWEDAINQVRNWLINGDMEVAARIGTVGSKAAISTTQYVLDRWKYRIAGSTAVVTISQDSTVPTQVQSGYQSAYSMKIDVTTADAAAAAGDLVVIEQLVEGPIYRQLRGKQVVFSFWIRSGKTGVHCAYIQNNGNGVGTSDRSYVVPFTINVADTWEKKSIQVTLDHTAGATEGYTHGATGLRVGICLMGGSTFQTTTGAWMNGNFNCTSAQVTGLDNVNTNIYIAQACLNLGTSPIPFTRHAATISAEEAECERFFEKSANRITQVLGGPVYEGAIIFVANGAAHREPIRFRTRKALQAPTVVAYNPEDGASGQWRDTTASLGRTVTVGNVGETGADFAANSVTVDGNTVAVHYTATAELV